MEKKNKARIFANNAYAVKTVWEISKKRIAHIAVHTAIGYAEWIFMSIFFMRFVIGAIESRAEFGTIMLFIGIWFAVFCACAIYTNYMNAVIVPITDNIIYRKLYRRLYAKARNVELRCFEDAAFYNRYTMALDGSSQKMVKSADCFFQIVFGIIAASAAFYSMLTIDVFSVLFLIFPLLGNFLFGRLMNTVWTGRYMDNVKHNRKAEYVNRVMHLAEFAKEIRYSNIHELMMKRYDEAVEGSCKTAAKWAKKGTIYTALQNIFTFTICFEGIMLYAAYRTIVSQTMELSELAVMFTAMSASSWILIGVFNNINDALKNGEFLEYYRTFMEYEEKIPENQEGIMPEDKVHSIEFRNVCFAYKEDENVINNLSFKIEGNKVCALVGERCW